MNLRNTLFFIKNKFRRDSTCMKSYPHQGIISSVSLQKLSSAFQDQKIHAVKEALQFFILKATNPGGEIQDDMKFGVH